MTQLGSAKSLNCSRIQICPESTFLNITLGIDILQHGSYFIGVWVFSFPLDHFHDVSFSCISCTSFLSSRRDPDQSSLAKTLTYVVTTVVTRYLKRIGSRNPTDTKIHTDAPVPYIKWSSTGSSSHSLPGTQDAILHLFKSAHVEPWIGRADCICFQSWNLALGYNKNRGACLGGIL